MERRFVILSSLPWIQILSSFFKLSDKFAKIIGMRFMITILIMLSLSAVANSTKVTFVKLNGEIYVETGKQHYAMYGPVRDKNGIRIIVVDNDDRYYLTSRCEAGWNSLEGHKVTDYRWYRVKYLKVNRECPAKTQVSSSAYKWSDTFSFDDKKFSVVHLSDRAIVYSSSYFPEGLAKVITNKDVIVFVYHDGRVVMKTINCLYLNEKILLAAIRKIDTSGKKPSLFSTSGEKAMRNYLKSHPIDESKFESEQRYIKTYTTQELAAKDRATRINFLKN